MLLFDNMDAYYRAISFIQDNQDNDLFTNHFADFTSYYAILESFEDEDYMHYEKYPNILEKVDEGDGTFSLEPTVRFNLIKRLLNKDAIVKIGQKVYKFTTSNVYAIDVNDPIESLVGGRYSDLSSLVSYPVTYNDKYLGVNDRSFCRLPKK